MVQVTSPSLLGQANLAGSDTALYLDMFSGEVLKTFREKNVMMGLHRTKTVGPGKSFQFPVIGQASASYHARGEDIFDPANNLLNLIEHGQRTISPDKLLQASTTVDAWDEKINHYEYRSEYAAQLGESIAEKMDRDLIQLIALAARDAATLSSTQSATKAGTVISAADCNTDASILVAAMVDAAVTLAQKDVPMDQMVFLTRPANYFAMIEDGGLLNVDFGNAGNGSQANGAIMKGYGFRIMWSNHIPSTVVAADSGERNTYSGDFQDTVAVAFTPDAVGTVIRQGMMTEQSYWQNYQTWLLTTKAVVGHGILRPECAVEIVDPNITP